MNRRMVFHILGKILLVEALLMLPSVVVGLIYWERATTAFIAPIIILAILGLALGAKKPKNREQNSSSP